MSNSSRGIYYPDAKKDDALLTLLFKGAKYIRKPSSEIGIYRLTPIEQDAVDPYSSENLFDTKYEFASYANATQEQDTRIITENLLKFKTIELMKVIELAYWSLKIA